ncbi:MucR family transcriptional regulator [Methylorubrum rhodesianum]|uniref:MucR family transcriptional regulator n=2 Tax=Methylorubrum rhodesianum TaxID=29427 RepID=A0ABU9Z4S7_9HYPH
MEVEMAVVGQDRRRDHVAHTVQVVSSYVVNNAVPVADLATLVRIVHAAFDGADAPETDAGRTEAPAPTRAQIRRSVGADGLISFIDGRTYQTHKRHLGAHGSTPAAYRECYGLPIDYPMVSPGYAARRSALAKQFGLGRQHPYASRNEARTSSPKAAPKK